MTKTLLLLLALSFSACGSRAEYSVNSATAKREADNKVLVTAVVGAQLLGVSGGEDQVTELCLETTWSNDSDFDGDAGTGDAGIGDAGTDAGTTSPRGVTLLPSTAVGATLSSATACKPGNSGTFELRSTEAVPQDRRVIVTLRPFESDASRANHTASAAPASFRASQFVSP